MCTSTTVGSTNVSSLFRQTPDLISLSDSLLFWASFFFFVFSFFEGFFIDFPSPTVHHCLTERTKQPVSILLPPSLSIFPSPLKTRSMPQNATESTRCQSSSFVRLLKRNEAVPLSSSLFEVHNLLSPSWLVSPTVWNVRVFRGLSRMAVYKLNKLATSLSRSRCVGKATSSSSSFERGVLLLKEETNDRDPRRLKSEWMDDARVLLFYSLLLFLCVTARWRGAIGGG